MGRPRISPEEHAVRGTYPQYDLSAPAFPGGRPKKPADLSPVADAEWNRLTRELRKRGTLTRVDASALEVYVRQFARWKKVVAEAEEHPTVESTWTDGSANLHTKIVENPASKIAGRLENSLRNMLKEFSATPASREKTRPATSPAKKAPLTEDQEYARSVEKQEPAAPPEEIDLNKLLEEADV